MPAAAGATLHTAFGRLALHRYPARQDETLRAWCAADELLIAAAAAGHDTPPPGTLVVNDDHGALALALDAAASWTDSALATQALRGNEQRNNYRPIPVTSSTGIPIAAARVVMRIPKQLAYFEYQLATLATSQPHGVPVIAGGMDKHLSPHTAAIMERYIGPTERQRGQRKARIFSATLSGERAAAPSTPAYDCTPLGARLQTGANVFSPDSLDRGSELLIGALGRLEPAGRLTDLACGNGVLGLAALQAGLARSVLFCDESAMAVAAARANVQHLFPDRSGDCAFHHGDGVQDYDGPGADLVLCNPPFHLQHTVDDFAGRRLLQQAARHLAPGGRLCVVANQHLPYHGVLTRHFKRVDELARSRRFVVWLASEPAGRRIAGGA